MFPPVEIMDTTLRDGEQTSGVSFNAREKLSIARLLLEELHVSRIEIASARVSQGEQQAVRAIAEWAAAKGYADRVEALGFIDGGGSLDWLRAAGGRRVSGPDAAWSTCWPKVRGNIARGSCAARPNGIWRMCAPRSLRPSTAG